MNPELVTTWTDYRSYLQKILLLATRHIRVFDEDLVELGLEKQENAFFLRRFLAADRQNKLQIVLRNPDPFRRNSPRLMGLFADYAVRMEVYECSPQLAKLNDALLLIDDSHALIRFHKDQARSKAIIDNSPECRPYLLRFEDILKEGVIALSAMTLGL